MLLDVLQQWKLLTDDRRRLDVPKFRNVGKPLVREVC